MKSFKESLRNLPMHISCLDSSASCQRGCVLERWFCVHLLLCVTNEDCESLLSIYSEQVVPIRLETVQDVHKELAVLP